MEPDIEPDKPRNFLLDMFVAAIVVFGILGAIMWLVPADARKVAAEVESPASSKK